MEIVNLNLFNRANFSNIKTGNFRKNQNFSLLSKDTVSFSGNISSGAMGKSDFEGLDLAVINRLDAPVEEFDSKKDFDTWCNNRILDITTKRYFGKQLITTMYARKDLLAIWYDAILNKSTDYTPAMKLLILDGITNNLTRENDSTPPVFNEKALRNTMDEIQKRISEDKNSDIDFNEIYGKKVRDVYLSYSDFSGSKETKTGWVKIKTEKDNPYIAATNLNILRALSCDMWNTKGADAEYLYKMGDHHIYMENGEPKAYIAFRDGKIIDIEGELNNEKIPVKYLEEIERYITESGFEVSDGMKYWIQSAQKRKVESDRAKADLKDALDNKDAKAIYNYFGIKTSENEDGSTTLSEYRGLDENVLFEDLELDEEELFKSLNVTKIEGDANFRDSNITSLGNLKEIGGDAEFFFSNIVSLGNLETIGGDAGFFASKIKNFGKLRQIGGDAHFDLDTKDLGNIEIIGGDAHLSSTEIENSGKLKKIGGDLIIGGKYTNITPEDFKDVQIGGRIQYYRHHG